MSRSELSPSTLRFAPLSPRRSLAITVVCTQAEWHGGEEQAALLLQGLSQRGHRCYVLARERGVFGRRMAEQGYEVATFRGRGRMPQTIWQIRRTLQTWQPDVLYYNDPHALTSAGIAALGLPIPLRVAARRVDFALNTVTRYKRLADIVICVSRAVEEVCARGGLSAEQLAVVHDGVDPRRMQAGDRSRGRATLAASPEATVVLTVARLTDHKGHQYFMQALPALVREYPNLIWAIAGDGDLRASLTQLAHELGVEQQVRFLGHRHDVPDLMAAADLMVVPSHMEGLCSSIVDAMLAGLPVVAARAGGIPDLLDRHRDQSQAAGWLVPPRDPVALTQAVRNALRFPHLTRQQASLARERAWREFTADCMVEQTLRVFERQLGQSHLAQRRAA